MAIQMRRPNLLIALAWFLNASAWFLPVVTGLDGGKIGPTFRGFEAFVMALSAVMPPNFANFGAGYSLLAILSVLTSLLFIIGSPWVILRGTRALRHFSAWTAAVAFFFNAHWNGWELGLGIGYFFWWLSFAVLTVGLLDLAGQSSPSESAQRQAALLTRNCRSTNHFTFCPPPKSSTFHGALLRQPNPL
jgi:hypothetical protein